MGLRRIRIVVSRPKYVLAGKLFNIPVKGTHAHAFVSSFHNADELKGLTMAVNKEIPDLKPPQKDFVSTCFHWQAQLAGSLKLLASESNDGEMVAFISYAIAFPHEFLALIDTYNVCKSGVLNFCSVALALNDFGYKALGVRIDSGDLAYLSTVVKTVFQQLARR